MSDRFSQEYFGDIQAKGQDKAYFERTLTSFKKKTLLKFLLSLPQGARVLDVGCGKGKAFALARAYRPDLVLVGIDGADLAGVMPQGVEYVRGDVEKLEEYFAPESFDALLNQHVLEHVIYPTACVQGMHRLLKEGGRVLIETPNWTRLFLPFSHLYFYNDYTHVRPYARFTLYRLLGEQGFSSVECRSHSSVPFFTTSAGAVPAAKKVESSGAYKRSLGAKILSRVVSPLVRDVLVAVAVK